ncbi:MAG: transglutaminase-like domain-containing protein, partial [Muribaculaceae bacterium]|nr:transglutaminase-like domain-containing protein [Muribaculaceae bacterium]
MTFKKTFLTLAVAAASLGSLASVPVWLETDRGEAIERRIRADFPYTVDEFAAIAVRHDSTLTRAAIDEMILNNYVETMVIDDPVRVFRKALRNLYLLDPARNEGWHHRGANPSQRRISYVDSVIDWSRGENPLGGAHRVVYSFSVEVPGHEVFDGDTVRVWMPVPLKSARQSDFEILETSQPDYILSDGRSVHNTIYFEAPAPAPGNTARFSYKAAFTTSGQYFSPEYIRSHIRPYDKDSELYRKYTATEAPHIIRMPYLATAIAGDLTDPFEISERVFDFISHYPWAGAREYSTIDCIPTYVLHEGHGDCGQVSLLYISLMRT